MVTMMYSFIFIYLLMFVLIQNSVAEYLAIRADPPSRSVYAEEAYSITCKFKHKGKFGLLKNGSHIAYYNSNLHVCQFQKDVYHDDYQCSAKYSGTGVVLKLIVRKAENYSTKIRWSCVVDGVSRTESLYITIRKDDNKDDRKDDRNKDLPPFSDVDEASSSESDDTNTMLISIVSAVGIMIMFITMIVGVYVCNKRKADQTEQAPTRLLAPESGGFPVDYHNVQSPSPLSYDWAVGDEDFGTYDVAHTEDVPESTNQNFDPSLLYGVVSKPGQWTAPEPEFNSNTFCGDPEPSNPNFDPERVYGSVVRS